MFLAVHSEELCSTSRLTVLTGEGSLINTVMFLAVHSEELCVRVD